MKKKTYKAIQNKLYKEMRKAMGERSMRIEAERRANYYEKRFRALGSNVETVNPGSGKALVMLRWQIEPEAWGEYAIHSIDDIDEKTLEMIKANVVQKIARGLVESNIVQFIIKGKEEWTPFEQFGSVGAKLYVVPWEQVAENGKKIEMFKYAENFNVEGKYYERQTGSESSSEAGSRT